MIYKFTVIFVLCIILSGCLGKEKHHKCYKVTLPYIQGNIVPYFKDTVIEKDTVHITYTAGSANYTRNPRIETGTIIWDPKIAAANIEWILEEINK
jgi:hypothetical protein